MCSSDLDTGDDKTMRFAFLPMGECHAWFVVLNEGVLRFGEVVRRLSE